MDIGLNRCKAWCRTTGKALVESCPKSLLSWPTAAVAAAAAATIPTSCSTAAAAAISAISIVPFYALTNYSVVPTAVLIIPFCCLTILVYCSSYLVTAVLINCYWLTATDRSVLFYLPYFTALTVCCYCYYCYCYCCYCYCCCYYYCYCYCYCCYFLFTAVLGTANRKTGS